MTEDDARANLSAYLSSDPEHARRLGDEPLLFAREGGVWVALNCDNDNVGVALFEHGTFSFHGALGKLTPVLGLPLSSERILGSAGHGRYQEFERGIGVWEQVDHGDFAVPIHSWTHDFGQQCPAIVAFFDFRGFTPWTKRADPSDVQGLIDRLEIAFQRAFSRTFSRIFAKGTGDGLMVLSEQGWYPTDRSAVGITPMHAYSFCRACAQTVHDALGNDFSDDLAIGCGIAVGPVNRIHFLGRRDYVGADINNAAKIQSFTFNELCLTEEVMKLLRCANVARDFDAGGQVLPGKGIRVRIQSFLE